MPATLEQSKTSLEPASIPPSGLLSDKIGSLRRKHVWVAVVTGVAIVVVVAIELLAIEMFLDWWLDLPWGVRLVLLQGQAVTWGVVLFRFVLVPLVRQPDEDTLALMVEKARPEFRSRLISAIQLTRPGAIPPGASTSMAEATIEETEALAQPVDFAGIVPTERYKKLSLLAAVVLLIAVLGMSAGGSVTYDLMRRAFLSRVPVPRKTRVFVFDGDKVIGRGDSVRLEAYVKGIIPSTGKLAVKYPSRRAQEYTVEQDKDDPAHYGRVIENVQESFTYVFHLNDGSSGTYQVKAIPRPTVANIECRQDYPAYTGLKAVRRSLGDLSLLAGSELRIEATATKPLEAASLKVVGTNLYRSLPLVAGFPPVLRTEKIPVERLPLAVNADRPTEFAGAIRIPAASLSGFSIELLDNEGMESKDSAVYRVEIIPDKAPQVRITYPDRKEELITRQAILNVGMEVKDDFEIAHLRLHYRVDTLDSGAEKFLELDLQDEHPHTLQRRFPWDIGAFQPSLPEGSTIEFWIEAVDNNDATGPGAGVSEHQVAKVVSAAEKIADLLNRAGDYLGSISDVTMDQEKLNQRLGEIIRPKLVTESNP